MALTTAATHRLGPATQRICDQIIGQLTADRVITDLTRLRTWSTGAGAFDLSLIHI